MKSILVIDQNKISILMTVEACKDVIPKAQVQVAYTGEEALKKLETKTFDLVIVDFDLPDCDGVSFIKELKKIYSIPMFLTAFPDPIVLDAIKKELFWFEDASRLISKPVDFKNLKTIISDLIFEEKKLIKTFTPSFFATISNDSKNKQKKDVDTKILKLTQEGASLKSSRSIPFIKNEKVTVSLYAENGKTKKQLNNKNYLIRASVFIVNSQKKEFEIIFETLSSQVLKKLETLLQKEENKNF